VMRPRRRRARNAVVTAAIALALVALTGCAETPPSTAPGGISVEKHSTAVPAPDAGTINETVSPADPGAVTKVSLTQAAKLPSGVIISLVKVSASTVTAATPGEIAGPAVVVRVRVTNNTTSPIDLGSTVVALIDSAGNPGQSTTAGPSDTFTGSAVAGASLEGTYVFGVPKSALNPVQITVSYAGGAPVALFAGEIS